MPLRIACLMVMVGAPLFGQTVGQAGLQKEIRTIAADAQGRVEVACALPGTTLNCDVEAHARPPMQSVFKLPLAMAVLHMAETKGWEIDRPVRFLPGDLLPKGSYSPLQDKYPQAGMDVPLRELLRLAVSLSDNAAADVLLRVIGGPQALTEYVASLGVKGFQAQDTEGAMHRNAQLQYRNWFEPAGAVQLLGRLRDRSPLNPGDTKLLLGWMAEAPGGAGRIKGMLPPGTLVMHKTGSSDTLAGVTAATNDIGLIVLPDGRQLALAVFVTDSRADEKTREAVIARIAKAVYEGALRRDKACSDVYPIDSCHARRSPSS
jgi:beta-lactamase class A